MYHSFLNNDYNNDCITGFQLSKVDDKVVVKRADGERFGYLIKILILILEAKIVSVSYNRVIVAFCEGQHDVAFLSRILLVNGFLLQDLKIGQLPPPFDKRFEKN